MVHPFPVGTGRVVTSTPGNVHKRVVLGPTRVWDPEGRETSREGQLGKPCLR